MFGFSLAELVVVFLVAIFFIKPKDLPTIAYFLGRIYYKIKQLFLDAKDYLAKAEKDLGLEEIKKEFLRAKISEENEQKNKKTTKIIDIHGNVHEVENLGEIRSDLNEEEIKKEISRYNEQNAKQAQDLGDKS